MQAIPALMQAGSSILGGIASAQAQGSQAYQLKQKAGQVLAQSQREALSAEDDKNLVLSRQTAVAGASGAGASDPTVQNIQAYTARRGEYNALSTLYSGKSAAQDMDFQATLANYGKRLTLLGAGLMGGGTILGNQNVQTMFDKYSGNRPPWMSGNTLPDASALGKAGG